MKLHLHLPHCVPLLLVSLRYARHWEAMEGKREGNPGAISRATWQCHPEMFSHPSSAGGHLCSPAVLTPPVSTACPVQGSSCRIQHLNGRGQAQGHQQARSSGERRKKELQFLPVHDPSSWQPPNALPAQLGWHTAGFGSPGTAAEAKGHGRGSLDVLSDGDGSKEGTACAPELGDTLAGLYLCPQCPLTEQSRAAARGWHGVYFPGEGKDSESLMGFSFLM